MPLCVHSVLGAMNQKNISNKTIDNSGLLFRGREVCRPTSADGGHGNSQDPLVVNKVEKNGLTSRDNESYGGKMYPLCRFLGRIETGTSFLGENDRSTTEDRPTSAIFFNDGTKRYCIFGQNFYKGKCIDTTLVRKS
jgi:hypothetical protein